MNKKLLAAIFGSVLVLGACGGDDEGDSNAGSDNNDGSSVAVDAEAVVQQKCISCHGGNLEGASAPALDKIGADLSEEEIHTIIVDGKGGMPGGLIKGDDADAVAAWLAEKK